MRVYVTGKVKGYTKQTLKEYIESKGHEFKSFTEKTDLLIVAERPGQGRLSNAREWGIDTMNWGEFEKKHLSGESIERSLDDPSVKMRVAITGKIQGMTTKEIKKIVKSMGYEYTTFSKTTELLVFGSRPNTKVMLGAQYAGIKRMKWDEFVKNVDFQKIKAKEDAKIDANNVRINAAKGSPFEIILLKETGIAMCGSMGLTNIDLTGIDKLANLTRLHLDGNRLTAIDLSPLRQVPNLSWLILSNNLLSSIDLSPIANSNLTHLELAQNNLNKIDLSPLALCQRLDTLILSSNRIQEIDLGPLTNCPYLEHLYLSENNLEEIDLSPLSGNLENLFLNGNNLRKLDLADLSSIRHLNLSRNQLHDIDVFNLVSANRLEILDVSHNQLKTFDLAPLSNLQSLKDLILIGNQLGILDLTPVAELWDKITTESYSKVYTRNDRREIYRGEAGSTKHHILLEIENDVMLHMDPVFRNVVESNTKTGFCDLKGRITWTEITKLAKKIYQDTGWVGLKKRLKALPKTVSMSALRMSELTGIEYSIEKIVELIPEDSSFDEGISIAYAKIVTALRDQLEKEESTFGFDIELMQETEASILIPRILELRRQEIEKIVLVHNKPNYVYLYSLNRTYYGSKIIKELNLGSHVNEENLAKLVEAFDDLGFKLNIQEGGNGF